MDGILQVKTLIDYIPLHRNMQRCEETRIRNPQTAGYESQETRQTCLIPQLVPTPLNLMHDNGPSMLSSGAHQQHQHLHHPGGCWHCTTWCRAPSRPTEPACGVTVDQKISSQYLPRPANCGRKVAKTHASYLLWDDDWCCCWGWYIVFIIIHLFLFFGVRHACTWSQSRGWAERLLYPNISLPLRLKLVVTSKLLHLFIWL